MKNRNTLARAQVFEEFVRTLPLNKLPASFNVSGTDASKDKLGRPIAEHIQIFCITKYRRLSMYAPPAPPAPFFPP